MKNEELMQQALEALENGKRIRNAEGGTKYQPSLEDKAITALRERLAQPEQEPVGQLQEEAYGRGQVMWFNKPADKTMLYASPQPEQPSKPLTDEQIQAAVTKAVRERKLSWLGFRKDDQGEYTIPVLSPSDYQMARAIEAKLREKNA